MKLAGGSCERGCACDVCLLSVEVEAVVPADFIAVATLVVDDNTGLLVDMAVFVFIVVGVVQRRWFPSQTLTWT